VKLIGERSYIYCPLSENGKNIVNILKKLAHEENRCVIVITHAAEVAAEADILLNMRDGELRKDS